MYRLLCVLVPCLLLSPSVGAEIYKCVGEKGAVKYQNFPCEIDSIGSSATESAERKPAPPNGVGKIDVNDPKALAELREWRLKTRPDHPTGKLFFETTEGQSPPKMDDIYTRFQAIHEAERLHRATGSGDQSVDDTK
jgi:hypothetical protein